MILTLGIDVAKTKLDVALRLPDGRIRSKVVANTDPALPNSRRGWPARTGPAPMSAWKPPAPLGKPSPKRWPTPATP